MPDDYTLNYDKTVATDGRAGMWASALAVVREYAALHGHVYPRAGEIDLPGNRDLLVWVGNVRKRHYHGLLLPEQVADLEAVPGWLWRRRRPRTDMRPGKDWWNRGVDELVWWVRRNRCLPRPDQVSPGGVAVGEVAVKVRERYRADVLDADTVARLEVLAGWEWTGWRRQYTVAQYARVHDFIAEHGRLPTMATRGERAAEYTLAAWITGRLTDPDRVDPAERDVFDELVAYMASVSPALPAPPKWQGPYLRLAAFVGEHGRWPTVAEDTAMRPWANQQRRRAAAGRLSELQLRLLNELAATAGVPPFTPDSDTVAASPAARAA